jgi:membrane-bound ClpP family serine protease
MRYPVDDAIHSLLNQKLDEIEKYLNTDFISLYGPIVNGFATHLKSLMEDLFENDRPIQASKLFFMLTTPGGSAIEAERAVKVLRHFYSEVNFVVPDYAYSAGTIFCMSGDNIYMNYFGVLGPIDPQILNKDDNLIPAQGYLDKISEFVEKSKNGHLSEAEIIMLGKIDLADLRSYEQARELAVDLLKKWLVQYKFKNWIKHNTNLEKKGKEVTQEEKIQRAEEIAKKLSDNNLWKIHGRGLDIQTLAAELRLEIVDYGQDPKLSALFGDYYALLVDYIRKNQQQHYSHTRRYI